MPNPFTSDPLPPHQEDGGLLPDEAGLGSHVVATPTPTIPGRSTRRTPLTEAAIADRIGQDPYRLHRIVGEGLLDFQMTRLAASTFTPALVPLPVAIATTVTVEFGAILYARAGTVLRAGQQQFDPAWLHWDTPTTRPAAPFTQFVLPERPLAVDAHVVTPHHTPRDGHPDLPVGAVAVYSPWLVLPDHPDLYDNPALVRDYCYDPAASFALTVRTQFYQHFTTKDATGGVYAQREADWIKDRLAVQWADGPGVLDPVLGGASQRWLMDHGIDAMLWTMDDPDLTAIPGRYLVIPPQGAVTVAVSYPTTPDGAALGVATTQLDAALSTVVRDLAVLADA